MKNDLKKELLKYSSAAAAVLAVNHAEAQYQYTNIPDTTVATNNGVYNLDLDQDGNPDFTLTQYVDTGAFGNTNAVMITPYTATINRVAGEQKGQYNYPFNLQAATIVGSNTDMNGCGGKFTNGYMAFVVDGQAYPNSNWIGPLTNGYLGLQLWKGLDRHYGWARLDIGDSSKSFTLLDFAVNLTADSSIIVGFELLGEVENMLNGVNIAVSDDYLELTKPATISQLNWRLLDATGKLLKEGTMLDPRAAINIAGIPASLYILELEGNGLVRREKLMLF